MPRKIQHPDPRDRSFNDPSQIISSNQVLNLYNQENPSSKKERVVESVQEWYKKEMENIGWTKAEFHGSQCVLSLTINDPTEGANGDLLKKR